MADRRRLNEIPLKPAAAQLRAERRNTASRTALLNRIRGEFEEMPGLCLTFAQAHRLFDIPPDATVRILGQLVEEGVLRHGPDGRYRWASAA